MTKKQKNRELERKLKAMRMRATAIFVALGIAVVVAIGWAVWDYNQRQWVMTFEGERIAVGDFMFFRNDPQTSIDTATRNLLQTLTMLHRGSMHGITLTPEERDEMTQQGTMFRQMFGIPPVISDERIGEFFSVDEYYFERLMDIYVPTYTPDPVEFDEEWVFYLEANFDLYTNHQVKIMTLENMDELNAAADAVATMGFDDAYRIFNAEFYEPGEEISTVNAAHILRQVMISGEEYDAIMALAEGQTYLLIEEESDIFAIFYMVSREEVDLAAMEASFYDQFVEFGRQRTFGELMDSWIENANYTINQRAINAL